jgi:integrase/recombinase XerD
MGKIRDAMVRDMELKGFSDSTKQAYLRIGKRLAAHFMRSPAELATDDIKEFLYQLSKVGMARASLSVYHAALTFMYAVTLRRPDVMASIPRPKVPRRKVRILTGSEIAGVLDAMPSLRHLAICSTTYAAGLRISETCCIQVSDIDGRRGQLLIRQAKGQKDRYVPLSAKLLELLRSYYRQYRPRGQYLFFGRSGDQPIRTRSFNRVLDRVSVELGLTPKVTPHHLRHAYANHMLELGTDMRVLQLLLGHADPKSTEHYVNVSERILGRLPKPLDILRTPEARILG